MQHYFRRQFRNRRRPHRHHHSEPCLSPDLRRQAATCTERHADETTNSRFHTTVGAPKPALTCQLRMIDTDLCTSPSGNHRVSQCSRSVHFSPHTILNPLLLHVVSKQRFEIPSTWRPNAYLLLILFIFGKFYG